jgi:hypothetical protein
MFIKRKNFDVFLTLIFCALLAVISACEAFGQRANTLERRCAGSAPVVPFAKVEVQRNGDINIRPCSGRAILLNGSPIATGIGTLNGLTASTQIFALGAADTAAFSSATSTHTLNLPITAVSGASRTNFFPFFNAANTFAKSPFLWNGLIYQWNNTALNSEYTMDFVPNLADGEFRVGDYTTTPTNFLTLSQSSNAFTVRATSSINLNSVNGVFRAGDINNAANETFFSITDSSRTFNFNSNQDTGVINFTDIGTFLLNRTITPGGTTGAQIIDKPAGTVNLAASETSISVTNARVSTNSIILVMARTNDATCAVKNYVAAAGSFVINMTAACTAQTSVGFFVTN